MKCLKCGEEVNTSEKFCRNCGAPITLYEQKTSDVNGANTDISFDEKLIKAYIGPKADKMDNEILNRKFSSWGFLFGAAYLAYRKIYLISIIFFVLLDVESYFRGITDAISIGLLVICSFCFSSIYKDDITKKLRRIKEENPNATEEELLALAKKKGGTSIMGVVGVVVINILLAFVITFVLNLIFK